MPRRQLVTRALLATTAVALLSTALVALFYSSPEGPEAAFRSELRALSTGAPPLTPRDEQRIASWLEQGNAYLDIAFGAGGNDGGYFGSSSTGGTDRMTAIAVATLVDQGLISYEDKVAKVWPEFAKNGKENVTVQEVMRHEAGLARIK